jgi:hypothetical protein
LLSHTAPPKHVLERFTFRDSNSRKGRAIWIYERGREARVSRRLTSEAAQHGYFAGAKSGEAEKEIDNRFNLEYEVPFNRLLPSFDVNLQILDSIEVRQICARYVAHIFRRTCALRDGGEKLLSSMLTGYMDIANDASWFKGYAAKVSILTSQAIKLEELREALIKHVEKYSTPEGQQSIYVDDIDRGTKWLATQLEQLNWSVIQTNSADEFLSQTLRSSQKPRVPLAM